jgi:hypothetical protein
MKSIALERRFSGYSFFAIEKRVTGSKGFESKLARKPVSDSARRAADAFDLPSTKSSPIQINDAYSGIKHAY